MSPKLPVISGEDLIRALEKFGYIVARQKGSHVRLLHPNDANRHAVTVPLHKELAHGALRRVLRDASITIERLVSVL